MAENKASKPSSFFEKFVPVLLLVCFALSFIVGVLWQKVSSLEKGGGVTAQTAQTGTNPAPTVSADTIKGLWDKNIIKFGDANRKLLFVEVADPSCPFCHVAAGHDAPIAAGMGAQFKYVSDGGSYVPPVLEMKKLVDEGKASFAWIYFPGHGNGEMATKALYCASDMGKFWEVHDLLMSEKGYEIQNGVTAQNTPTKGPNVGNDKAKSGQMADFLKDVADQNEMKKCLDSGKYDGRLAEEQSLSTASLGVSGTPGFYVNTTNFGGAYSWTDMKSAVDAALK